MVVDLSGRVAIILKVLICSVHCRLGCRAWLRLSVAMSSPPPPRGGSPSLFRAPEPFPATTFYSRATGR